MAKQWAHDKRLGYTGDANGNGAYPVKVSASTGKDLGVGKITHSLGNGFYYAVNPREAAISESVLAELKALAKPAKVAKEVS